MYLAGFGHQHSTEAIAGALPPHQNSPQNPPFGLYTEQLSGSAFTRPRHLNLHTWLYRQHPSTIITDFVPYHQQTIPKPLAPLQPPNPMRWSPLSPTPKAIDFLDGLFHLTSSQNAHGYLYQCNQSMHNRFFTDRDGELLFIPYEGRLQLRTELGQITIQPGMIAVIPRGIVFTVDVLQGPAQGYLCENKATPFTLPELGILGANGLANPRHFLYPNAAISDEEDVNIICKYQDQLWQSNHNKTPLNVVAWQGNYAPYCYDLSLFNTINTVSFDHPDPSIFTVLTSASEQLGVANLDFVIFPPRWMVAEHTFRPPYFHRNIMSEWMGLIKGEYDAKKTGFIPGGSSIHNGMTPHGPDATSVQQAQSEALTPSRYDNTLAFMLESNTPWLITEEALTHPSRQQDYTECWRSLCAEAKHSAINNKKK